MYYGIGTSTSVEDWLWSGYLFNVCVVYGNSMEDDVAGDLSGDLKRVMVALMTARRPENTGVDPGRAQRDANELKSAGVDKWGQFK